MHSAVFVLLGALALSAVSLLHGRQLPAHEGVNAADGDDEQGGELKRGTCATPSPYTEEEKQALVDYHNKIRRSVGASNMLLMEWDEDLSCGAQAYAEQCVYEHSAQSENLAKIWTMDTLHAASLWAGEKEAYSYENGCLPDRVCGHYTQMVWHDTYKVGCAKKWCWDGHIPVYHICRYSPGGNINGVKHPYSTGEACSACPETPYCEKEDVVPRPLCIGKSTQDNPSTRCVRKCQNGGVVNCDCTCKCNGYYGPNCEYKCEDEAYYALDCDDDPEWFCEMGGGSGDLTWGNRHCPKTCGTCKVAGETDASFVDCDFNN